jgi:uridine kinase
MQPFIIGITGGSGSGKTSFIKSLRSRFPQESICIISQDEYYRHRDEQVIDETGVRNFDLPASINYEQFKQDIKTLVDGHVVEKQEYTFNNPEAVPTIIVYQPTPVLIIEGLFVLYDPEIRRLLNLSIFIHAKENLKVIRRIKRDQIERNYPLEDVLYRYEKHVLPSYESYIKPFMDDCDLVINNNHSFQLGLDVLTGFIRDKLQYAES